MRSHLVVAAPELLDHDFGIDPILEPFHRQALVAELAVEAFVQSILPWLARIDRDGLDVGAGERSAAAARARSPFFAATSFITSISRSHSANSFFSLVFSCSN